MAVRKGLKPKHFIVDVDGVMTDGRFYYTPDGKAMKAFGPDDHDGLLLLKPYLNIHIVSGDKKGFPITQKRVADDMKMRLDLVSTVERVRWMEESGYKPEEVIYMGDGIFDAAVFDKVGYSIAPANAFYLTKKHADFVTHSAGGDSAVAEACVHILKKFFKPFDPLDFQLEKSSGEWASKK
jgi:3-deoxy-D-manno-octulosonate 8-phosphate phosphatase (KDO 8-P phosphatase)